MADRVSQQKRDAKIVQKESNLLKEFALLTYTVNQLIDAVRQLTQELHKSKVIQIPYPIYPAVSPQPTPLTPNNPSWGRPPIVGDDPNRFNRPQIT